MMFTPRHSPRPPRTETHGASPGSAFRERHDSQTADSNAWVERRDVEHCGVYGIGLKIDVLSPHEVGPPLFPSAKSETAL